jgi:hypothetical protein
MNAANSRLLPIVEPPITSYAWHAAIWGILGNYPKTQNWLFCNNVQLYGSIISETLVIDFDPSMAVFYLCPFIMPQVIGRDFIAKHYRQTKDFIIEAIDADSYVLLTIEQSEINELITGQKHDIFNHLVFIRGYDLERNIFNVADFTFRNKYAWEELDIDLVDRAYGRVSREDDDIIHGRSGVVLFNYTDRTFFDFDFELLKQGFVNYLSEDQKINQINHIMTTTSYFNGLPKGAGLGVYPLIYQYIEQLKSGKSSYDKRMPHVFYDHKIIMAQRIQYMLDNNYLLAEKQFVNPFDEIRDKSLQLRNLFLKCMISGSTSGLQKLIDGYKFIEEQERTLYPQVINKLAM